MTTRSLFVAPLRSSSNPPPFFNFGKTSNLSMNVKASSSRPKTIVFLPRPASCSIIFSARFGICTWVLSDKHTKSCVHVSFTTNGRAPFLLGRLGGGREVGAPRGLACPSDVAMDQFALPKSWRKLFNARSATTGTVEAGVGAVVVGPVKLGILLSSDGETVDKIDYA